MTRLFVLLVAVLITAFATGCGTAVEPTASQPEATQTPAPTLEVNPTPQEGLPTPGPNETAGPTLPPMASLPCRFHGQVLINGAPVPDGTIISAIVGGDTYTTTTPSPYGDSTYLLQIAPDPGISYQQGTVVQFFVGEAAAETGSWVVGGNEVLDLAGSSQ